MKKVAKRVVSPSPRFLAGCARVLFNLTAMVNAEEQLAANVAGFSGKTVESLRVIYRASLEAIKDELRTLGGSYKYEDVRIYIDGKSVVHVAKQASKAVAKHGEAGSSVINIAKRS